MHVYTRCTYSRLRPSEAYTLFLCTLPYTTCKWCAQMHKHKYMQFYSRLFASQRAMQFCFAFGFDSGFRVFDYCLSVQIIIRKCTLRHNYWQTHAPTHTTHSTMCTLCWNECASLRAWASPSLAHRMCALVCVSVCMKSAFAIRKQALEKHFEARYFV